MSAIIREDRRFVIKIKVSTSVTAWSAIFLFGESSWNNGFAVTTISHNLFHW
jgi:hypothetical protein